MQQSGLRNTHRRYVTPLLTPPFSPDLYEVQTHQGCHHNELRSLHNRHLKGMPDTLTLRGLKAVSRELKALSGLVGRIRPVGRDVIVAHAPGRKKRLYQAAADSLSLHEIDKRDAEVKMFIKADRYDARDVAKKEPRAIQYRSPRYNIELQRYLHPFEQKYYTTVDAFRGGPVKGKNSWQRAAIYEEALNYFADPIVINLDFSKFDAHLTPQMLKEERKAYLRACSDPYLAELLSYQAVNSCRTQLGTKYRVTGSRMSGDVNTGLGNTMLAEAMVRAWATRLGIKMVPFVDGDDVVMIVERGASCPMDFFVEMGMEAVVETLEADQLVHCQSKIIRIGKRARMVRNPWRAISHGCSTLRNYPTKLLGPLLAAMGQSELACSNGVPILQEWALAQMRVSDSVPWAKCDESIVFRAKLEGRSIPLEITSSARDDFYHKFGISVSTQLAYEAELSRLGPEHFAPAGWVDVYWYEAKESAWEEG